MTRYLSLGEFWYLAEYVTGIEAQTLIKASRVDLADSALHAPAAGFEDTDFYPDLFDKAAVLACRISWNHTLPDGYANESSSPSDAASARGIDDGSGSAGIFR